MTKHKKLVRGVDINDADYDVVRFDKSWKKGQGKRKREWVCPFYHAWMNMLTRAYSGSFRKWSPAYEGVSVYEEWHRFSTFKSWMEQQDWEGNQLDKDLLVERNRVYSPDTCVFVSPMVNMFIRSAGRKRDWLPDGITLDVYTKKGGYVAQLKYLDSKVYAKFPTIQEAYSFWLEHKRRFAEQLAAIQTNPLVAEALVRKYQSLPDEVPSIYLQAPQSDSKV